MKVLKDSYPSYKWIGKFFSENGADLNIPFVREKNNYMIYFWDSGDYKTKLDISHMDILLHYHLRFKMIKPLKTVKIDI
jgi:hypothetical protein